MSKAKIKKPRPTRRDREAIGPNPRRHVPVPKPGERCRRCHSGARARACLLCRPDLVSPSGVVACSVCGVRVGVVCDMRVHGRSVVGSEYVHLERLVAAAHARAEDDAQAFGFGVVRTLAGGMVEYVPAETVKLYQRKTKFRLGFSRS